MIRVAIADSEPVFRLGLRGILSGEPDMRLSFEADSAGALFRLIRDCQCDVLIAGTSLQDRSWADVFKEVKALQPELPILVLSSQTDQGGASGAIRAGAGGYLTKESAPEEVVRAIRTVVTGDFYITSAAARALALEVRHQATTSRLSQRESQIASLYGGGKTVTEIAASTGVSTRTVSTYKARTMEKLHLQSNAALVTWAVRNGATQDQG